jgi:hypothetical protein
MLDNGSCTIRREKKKRLQKEVNQLNIAQEWDKKFFSWRNNLKHNINYNRCQKNI